MSKLYSKYINYATNLGNMPPNLCTPNYLYDEACKLRNLGCNVHCEMDIPIDDNSSLVGDKLGLFNAVARGAWSKERFIVISYKPKIKKPYDIALVGKGITFDSGGLNIKPGISMNDMRFDMMGAAYCLSAVKYAAENELKRNVLVVLPCCENAVGGDSYRPSDVIKAYSGLRVEIGHTDAEGRLVLADALYYASLKKPKRILDIATLTGCAHSAVGNQIIPYLCDNDKFQEDIIKASHKSKESFWPLPLHSGYVDRLKTKSKFSDVTSCLCESGPDTIMAALFLRMFTKKVAWAHLDIASVAHDNNKATGIGLATVIEVVKRS